MIDHVETAALSSGMATRTPGGGVAFGGAAPSAAAAVGAQREPEQTSTQSTSFSSPSRSDSGSSDELSPERIEELASRLYDGIRSRLRRDLLLQRERSGSLFDHR